MLKNMGDNSKKNRKNKNKDNKNNEVGENGMGDGKINGKFLRSEVRGVKEKAREVKGVLNKKSVKLILIFLAIVAIAVFSWCALYYFSPEAKEDRAAQKFLEVQREMYENDTYGGATPEETLSLFIKALEEGDVELASKYFGPEDREGYKKQIKEVKDKNELGEVLERFNQYEEVRKREKEAFFGIKDEQERVIYETYLKKNINGVWKIIDL